MATQNINIVISQTGGVSVIRTIQQIGGAATNALNPLRLLQAQINAVMGALALKQITDWADEWTSAANKVSVFSKNQAETNEVLTRLRDLANGVGQPLNSVVDLYHKLSIQAKALGASVEDNIRVTDIISKSLTIQGTKAQAAHGALLQLSQTFGTGKVKAQEYNSLLTGMPLVLQVVSNHIKEAGGSVAKLTLMQRAGQLSSKAFYDAILAGGDEIDKLFGKQTRTFEQAFNVLNNGLTEFFGKINESLGISNAFFKIAKAIVVNLESITKYLAVIAVGVAAAFAPAIVTAFAGALGMVVVALGRITALLLANPFVLIAAAVAAVYQFGDAWDAGIDGMTTVKDVAKALVSFLLDGFYQVMVVLTDAWDMMVTDAQTAYDTITGETTKATSDWTKSYKDFYADTGDGFWGLVTAAAKTFDAIGGLILGSVYVFMTAFGQIPAILSNAFAKGYNEVAGWIEKMVNATVDGINKIREYTGGAMLESLTIERKSVKTEMWREVGATLGDAFAMGFEVQGDYLVNNVVKPLEARAKAMGNERRRLAGLKDDVPDLSERNPADALKGKGKKGKEDKSVEKLTNQLRSLLNQIYPAEGALLEMKKAQDTLTAAVAKGIITEEQRAKYLVQLKLHYQDIIDPLSKYIKDVKEDIELSKISSRERGIEATLLKQKQDLLLKGMPMTEQQIADMRTLLQLQRDMNEAAAARDSLESGSSATKNRNFDTQLKAIQELMKDPSKFNRNDATNALMQENADLFAGTQEALLAQTAAYQNMYTQIDAMRQADLISAQTAAQMKAKVDGQLMSMQLANYSSFFGSLESLSQSSNKKLAAIGKAAAVANATIKGFEAVQVALASAPPPYNYALAAGVAIQAASNVAKIMSTDTAFATGGQFTVGGSGGVDSQMVAFRASPGEQVAVSTPTQVRKGTAGQNITGGASAAQPVIKPNIINVLDPSVMSSYMRSADGEQAIINVIQNNPAVVRSAVQGGR